MHEQDPCGGLEAAAAVEVGRGGLEKGFAGRGQRTVDPVDHGPTSCGVPGQNALDQQFVRKNGAGSIGPGASGDQAREGGSCRASRSEKVWHRGADDDGTVAEVLGQCLDSGGRILQAPEDDNQTMSLYRSQRLDLEARSGSSYEVNDFGGVACRTHACDHGDGAV